VGHYDAEISNSFVSNKAMSFKLQAGCIAFRLLTKIGLRLKFKSSVMSASLQARLRDLYTTARRISLLPIGIQTPVSSSKTRGGRSTRLWGMPFLTATAVLPFVPG
jgi:hypothetical protein